MNRAALILVLAACQRNWKSPPVPDAPIDAPPAACAQVGCPPSQHCEVECTQYGPPGCIYNCHTTCVPDEPCSHVTTCAPPTVCAETCSNECGGMADLCREDCEMPSNACNQITDENTCKARSDCTPVYVASGCSCPDIVTCTCTNEKAAFSRCEPGS